jgi:hypothetical protein
MTVIFRFVVLALLCVGASISAKGAPMSLDQLPTSELFNPRQPIAADCFPEQQADLVRRVAAQVNELDGYHIVDQRMFVFTGVSPAIGPQWVVIHAELGNQLVDRLHAKEISRVTRVTGPAAMSVWSLPDGAVIAIAQSQDLPDGNALVGYFSLAK